MNNIDRYSVQYNGTSRSVDRIMDIVGTKGVNNTLGKLYIHDEVMKHRDLLVVQGGDWWIERDFQPICKRYPVLRDPHA